MLWTCGRHGDDGLRRRPLLTAPDIQPRLGAELAPQVRVNCLAPGLVKTDFARVLWEDGRGDKVAKGYPLERLGEPEDVAAATLFLAAETSRWITGQTWVLDGGGLIKFNVPGEKS